MRPKETEETALNLERALEVAGWPRALMSPEKQPKLINDAQAIPLCAAVPPSAVDIATLFAGPARLHRGGLAH